MKPYEELCSVNQYHLGTFAIHVLVFYLIVILL